MLCLLAKKRQGSSYHKDSARSVHPAGWVGEHHEDWSFHLLENLSRASRAELSPTPRDLPRASSLPLDSMTEVGRAG